MSESMTALFDTIRRHDLTADNLDQLYDWPASRLSDLMEMLSAVATTDETPPPRSEFVFSANNHLSGAPSPCGGTECRVPPATNLARFAALYADRVLVRNPLEYHHEPRTTRSFGGRNRIIADISVALTFEPLIEAGIVSFTSSTQHWCPICVYMASKKGELPDFVGESDAAGWQGRVGKMVEHLRKEFLGKVNASIHKTKGKVELELTGDSDLIPHGTLIHHSINAPKSWIRDLQGTRRKVLTSRQLWSSRILYGYIEAIIDDMTTQNHYAEVSGANYITDRGVDLRLVDAIAEPSTRTLNKTSLAALAHGLPFLADLSLQDILHLRKDEGEAFRVYRDAVSAALATAKANDERRAREAFADIVRPELNKIDLIVSNARRTLAKSAATELGTWAVMISVALFSGILPPDWAHIFAALGGITGGKGVATKLAETARFPKEARDNRYFFLWKLRKLAKGSSTKR